MRSQFPELGRWATWCYGAPSHLQFGDSTLQSAGGVQQGNPLGPLFFATALQPLATELRNSPLDLATFYLDDGLFAGDVRDVAHAFQHVQQRCVALGLELNLQKYEVVASQGLVAHFPDSLLRTLGGDCRLLRNL